MRDEAVSRPSADKAFDDLCAAKHLLNDYKDLCRTFWEAGRVFGAQEKDAEWMQRMVDTYAKHGRNGFGEMG